MHTKIIFVSGGVISGVGKGVASAAIGKILKEHGYATTLMKIDPYINYDAGTLRPTEHGEVWITDDGGEIDLDFGTYERFLNTNIPKKNSITTGQIYKSVIDRERHGKYLGQTVQLIPHVTDEVKRRIREAYQGYDIAIVEIGGTVGDFENIPYLAAAKSLELERGSTNVAHILVTYLPIPSHLKEMKTKPTQQAIRMLGEQGITPSFIICRGQYALDPIRTSKIEAFSHISKDRIISAPDVPSVYQVPIEFEKQEFGSLLLKQLGLESKQKTDWRSWKKRIHQILSPKKSISIAVVGKYLSNGDYQLSDSYLSIQHALEHAGTHYETKVMPKWIDADTLLDDKKTTSTLQNVDGIIIPGGFGTSGIDGKINAIRYARTSKTPYLGICYGMQLAVVEFARSVCGLTGAHTTEVDPTTPHPVIDILPMQKTNLTEKQFGGTMRCGAYQATLEKKSLVRNLYNDQPQVSERHRHRYEINPQYAKTLEINGLIISGANIRSDGTKLAEFIELSPHPFFVATQAHPESTSRFEQANPLFLGLLKAGLKKALTNKNHTTKHRATTEL